MPARRLIPSLLLRGDRLVKGKQFGTYRDAGNPVTTARAHNAQGADELILLDIDASIEQREPRYDLFELVASECFMPLAIGGGIRSLDIARRCMDAGGDKLCINTGALDNPQLISDLARLFGSQAIVASVDIGSGDTPPVIDHRTGKPNGDHGSAKDWIAQVVDRGAGEVRLVAYDNEGMRAGFPCRLIDEIASVSTPVVVEGGIGSFQHVSDAYSAGADGVSLGTMLVFEDNNLVKVKRALRALGHEMRT